MTYLIDHDYENYYSLTLDVVDLSNKMPSYSQRFRAKPRLDSWVAPKASFYASDNYQGTGVNLPDITTWALGNLVLSPKAYLVFTDIIGPSGEFLPLIVGDDMYYMFNTLSVIPESAIDFSEAIDVIDSGVHMGQDNIRFDEETLKGYCLFKSSTDKLTHTFSTKKFKSIYSENCFTGLVFNTLNS
ncbi:MAG: hypothetical protein KUG82_21165 [Pseudomonadales bacterium]|nr:hypothetical protein [Pseudomonadales bacterium]